MGMGFSCITSRALVVHTPLSALVRALGEKGVAVRLVGGDVEVCGMNVDSRAIEPDDLFVCKGAAFKPAYLAGAMEKGAAAYLCAGAPAPDGAPVLPEELAAAAPGTPALVVDDVRRAMALVAPLVYGHPEERLEVVGITGTKGKTTVSYMLRSILEAAQIPSSILGSIETDDGIERFESHNTTPEAPDLWRHLSNSVRAQRGHMVMEVSSQGLKYDRVLGLTFDIACFLNIGRDHISAVEHPTFEDYFASKLKIFTQCRTAVVNLDTDRMDEVLCAARSAERLMTVSIRDGRADFFAMDIASTPAGLSFEVREKGDAALHAVRVGMAGLFNVENALAALAIARALGVGYDAIGRGLGQVRVPGRMELVSSADGKVVAVIDYAHNELSFETLFSSIAREYPGRRVVAVFGAPGGKAYERREVLPRVAGAHADHLIYTEEDPAHDAVEDICAEMAANTPEGVAHEVVCDREQAIARAFEVARGYEEGSVVLLLGKGDETRQHRGDEFPEVKSDLALARELLA